MTEEQQNDLIQRLNKIDLMLYEIWMYLEIDRDKK